MINIILRKLNIQIFLYSIILSILGGEKKKEVEDLGDLMLRFTFQSFIGRENHSVSKV